MIISKWPKQAQNKQRSQQILQTKYNITQIKNLGKWWFLCKQTKNKNLFLIPCYLLYIYFPNKITNLNYITNESPKIQKDTLFSFKLFLLNSSTPAPNEALERPRPQAYLSPPDLSGKTWLQCHRPPHTLLPFFSNLVCVAV